MSAPTDLEAMGAESGRPHDAMAAAAASAAASAADAGGADSSSSSTATVAAAAEPRTYAARLQSLEEPLLLQSADGHAPAPLDSADSSSSSFAALAPAAPSSSPSLSNSPPASLSPSFWLMFFLLALVLMLAESSRGVVIPTLALYQQSLGGSTAFLSALVALFSVGRLLSSVHTHARTRHDWRAAAGRPRCVWLRSYRLLTRMHVHFVFVCVPSKSCSTHSLVF